MTRAPRPAVSLADAAAALAAAGVEDAERRALLAQVLATRGEAQVATAVHNTSDPDRGSLLAAVVDDRPFLLDTLLVAVRRSGHTARVVEHPVLSACPRASPWPRWWWSSTLALIPNSSSRRGSRAPGAGRRLPRGG